MFVDFPNDDDELVRETAHCHSILEIKYTTRSKLKTAIDFALILE
jgi:hypothetical protein